MAILSHESPVAQTTTWLTPPSMIELLGPFDLDPCTPGYMPWSTAVHRFTEKDDGLSREWFGRVWLNPPYGKEVDRWMKKMASHGDGIALIFARTETSTWHEHIWPIADGILFLKGRIKFHKPDGTLAKANAGSPSALIAYGNANLSVLKECGLAGKLVVANQLV